MDCYIYGKKVRFIWISPLKLRLPSIEKISGDVELK